MNLIIKFRKIYIKYNYLPLVESIEDLYAFHYSPQEDKLVQSAGWQLYDITTEFYRMQIPGELWVESKMNRDYKVFFSPILTSKL